MTTTRNILWKPIMINNKVSNYMISNSGSVKNKSGTIMKPYLINSGYLAIKLSMNDVKYHFLIHRLVAIAFIPNPNNLPEVNHKDGNKTNDWVWNLEWSTKKDNMIHAATHNLLKPKVGIENPFAKHDESQIHKACQLMEEGKLSLIDISNITGVTYTTLTGIKHGGKWKEISSQYDIHKNDREPLWDETTKAAISILHDQGYTHSAALRRIGLPDSNANQLRVGRLVNKVKTSTTIPWIVFDFNYINNQ